MSASTSTSSLLQDLVGDLYSRRLLLIHSTTVYQPPSTAEAPPPSGAATTYNTFDANVIMVLSVLLCALICSLGLNSIIRCTLRCSAMMSSSRRAGGATAASTGVKRKAVKSFATVRYAAGMNLETECVICLSEFAAGERVRLLPKCHHGFHVRCIDKWLSAHSSCPTCRDCLIDTCQKIVGDTSEIIPAAVLPVPVAFHVVNVIEPLAPEAMVRNYRGIS